MMDIHMLQDIINIVSHIIQRVFLSIICSFAYWRAHTSLTQTEGLPLIKAQLAYDNQRSYVPRQVGNPAYRQDPLAYHQDQSTRPLGISRQANNYLI